MITGIFLVINLWFPVEHQQVNVMDSRQPDMETCWAEARKQMDRLSKIDGVYEIFVSCQAVHDDDGPPA